MFEWLQNLEGMCGEIKVRQGLDEDATHGMVSIFSGITHLE